MNIPHLVPAPVLLSLGFSLAMMSPPSRSLAQETGAIHGRVESSLTNEVLAGVKVSVKGEDLEALTGEDGEFRLKGLASGAVHLTLEFPPDFVTTIEEVIVRPGIIIRTWFQMEPVAVILEEILVKGRPETSGALVRTFAAGEARALTGGGTAVDLLSASFSGIQVIRGSGQAGAGSRLLIRGTNSITIPGDPLVYMDGVRVNHTTGTVQSETGHVLGFLDMIPADMVARIEVLKGPSATRYGVGSSNGVILIFTR